MSPIIELHNPHCFESEPTKLRVTPSFHPWLRPFYSLGREMGRVVSSSIIFLWAFLCNFSFTWVSPFASPAVTALTPEWRLESPIKRADAEVAKHKMMELNKIPCTKKISLFLLRIDPFAVAGVMSSRTISYPRSWYYISRTKFLTGASKHYMKECKRMPTPPIIWKFWHVKPAVGT